MHFIHCLPLCRIARRNLRTSSSHTRKPSSNLSSVVTNLFFRLRCHYGDGLCQDLAHPVPKMVTLTEEASLLRVVAINNRFRVSPQARGLPLPDATDTCPLNCALRMEHLEVLK